MLEINKFKINLYELLYCNPLCDYRLKGENNNTYIHVLYIGKAEKAVETYKTLFWCSQYPNCSFHMTIAGHKKEIEIARSRLEDEKEYPALEEYIKEGYASKARYVELMGEDVESELDKWDRISEDVKRIDLAGNLYTFVIIATEDACSDVDYFAAIGESYQICQDRLNAVLIAVYNDGLDELFAKRNWKKLSKNVCTEQFEKSEDVCLKSDLFRVASNINLAYSLKYDQRLSVKDNLEEFFRLCAEEYGTKDYHGYHVDSSFASAVHIPYKLAYCLDYNGEVIEEKEKRTLKALELLADAGKTHNALFNELLVLEHRRWSAYMVSRGYRHPKKEEKGFLYDGKHKNVDHEKKLHVCICKCGLELNPMMNKKEFWECKPKNLNQLDYESWNCHNVAAEKANELEKTIYYDYSFLSSMMFRELKEAIEELFRDGGNANAHYKNVYRKIMAMPEITKDDALKNKLQKLNQDLEIVRIRNQKVNYFAYDAQLVEMIPFCMWYGKNYDTVYVFSMGIATKDVVIPTLLYVKKAIFVSEQKLAKEYQNVIKEYFKVRGSNTSPEFVDAKELFAALCTNRNRKLEQIVIAGEGPVKERFIEEYKNVLNIRYNAKEQLIEGNTNVFYGLERQSFSVKEYIRLLGGDVINTFYDSLSKDIYQKLESLFWKYAKKKMDVQQNGGTYKWIPWNKSVKILDKKNLVGMTAVPIEKASKDCIYIYDNSVSEHLYKENGIDKFISSLLDYHLIGNFQCVSEAGKIHLKFLTYHKELCNALDLYRENKEQKFKNIYFIGDIKERNDQAWSTDCLVNMEAKTYEKNENYNYDHVELKIFEDLRNYGFISDIKKERNQIKALTIKDARIAELLEKEGNVFEKITYHRMEKSGFFDDFQNGVSFHWNKIADQKNESLERLRKEIKKQADQDILGLVDADSLCKTRNDQFRGSDKKIKSDAVSNEIDVIAIRGMQAYFISCKATSEIVKEYLYEIGNHAKKAGAVPILATCLKQKECSDEIKRRAKEDQIWLVSREELEGQDTFDAFIKKVVEENVPNSHLK